MKNTEIRNLLIIEYKMCFLGGIITRENPYTLHHIIPVRRGGSTTLSNGALLGNLQHQMFNVVESTSFKKAEELNDYFMYFKETKDLQMLKQMKYYIESEIQKEGYKVIQRHKTLILTKY